MDASAATFLTLGALLLLGLLADEGGRRVGLPNVTILLLLGVGVGQEGLDLLPEVTDDWFPVVSTIALTMVGFILGAQFTSEHLRSHGREDFVIAITQGLVTATVVSGGLLVFGVDTAIALALGGVAVATAPAATLAVVSERGAAGPFTRTLLSVVAIDDVIALTLFGLLVSTATFLEADGGSGVLLESLWEVGGAVALGGAIGLPAAYLSGRLKPGLPTQEEAYAIVLLCAGLAELIGVSFLLAAVVLGATLANKASHHERPFQEIERIEWPALVVFFVLAGAALEISSLREVGWLGFGYIALRIAGKLLGCAFGGSLGGLGRTQSWSLGRAMLPQAGVAIGLTLFAAERFPDIAEELLAVVLAATAIFELFGPVITKRALERVGEAGAFGTSTGEVTSPPGD